jgi:hypothetical protein
MTTIGHNHPPDGDALTARLAETTADLAARSAELLAAVERVPATLDDEAIFSRSVDFTAQIKAHVKAIDKRRTAEKEPFLSGGRAVDAFFSAAAAPLTAAVEAIDKRLNAYLRAKEAEARRQREAEAARLRAEAEALAAAAQTEATLTQAVELEAQADATADHAARAASVDLTRTHAAMGSTVSLSAPWTFEVVDRNAVDLVALRPYLPAAAVDQAIRGFVRAGGRNLAGVDIYQTRKVNIR